MLQGHTQGNVLGVQPLLEALSDIFFSIIEFEYNYTIHL